MWTAEEDQIIIDNRPRIDTGEIRAADLVPLFTNRTKNAIIARMRTINLHRQRHPWTEQEDRVIIKNIPRLDAKEIKIKDLMSQLPNRSYEAIRSRRYQLSHTQNHYDTWTEQEEKALAVNNERYRNGEITLEQLAALFPNRSIGAIRQHIAKIDLPRKNRTQWPQLHKGDKINYLTLIEQLPTNRQQWRCRCICQKEVNFYASELLGDNPPMSCGCYSKAKQTSRVREAQRGIVEHTNTKVVSRTTPNKNNTSGHRNIYYLPKRNQYRVDIQYKRQRHQFYCTNIEDAIKIRDKFKEKIMPEIEALDAARQAEIPNLIKRFETEFIAATTTEKQKEGH